MDAPLIVTNVEFSEVRKGYDPEEVDNYLRGVDQRLAQVHDMLRDAVERAEAAEAKLAEAMRAKATADQTAAEALVRATEAEQKLAEGGGDDGTDAMKKMLMLAQRTADSAVEEAQASAKNIVADARSKSAEIVAEAENRSERILVEAQKVADELRQERTAAIAEEVDTLQSRKADLLTDIEALETYLEDHRVRLRSGVEAITALLEGDLRLEDRPVVHPDPSSAAEPVRPSSATSAPAPTTGPTPVAVGTAEPAARPATTVGDLQEAPAPATPTESAAADDEGPEAPAAGGPAPEAAKEPAPGPARDDVAAGGPPTQPISAVQPAAGEPTPSQAVPIVAAEAPAEGGDDEAMRRFFDDDLEVSDERKGGLFRKK